MFNAPQLAAISRIPSIASVGSFSHRSVIEFMAVFQDHCQTAAVFQGHVYACA
jgi:hypothetical protein